jgi:hypothetical protein
LNQGYESLNTHSYDGIDTDINTQLTKKAVSFTQVIIQITTLLALSTNKCCIVYNDIKFLVARFFLTREVHHEGSVPDAITKNDSLHIGDAYILAAES